MSTRTHRTLRTRMLVAAAVTAATLTLAACNNGEGVHDEGASASTASTASTTPSPKASGGTSTGAGQTDPANSTSEGSTGGAAGSSGTTGSSGSTGSEDSASASTPCADTSTRTTATEVSRPLNHLLLTVTNTGSKNCDLTGYPAVRFGEAQSVPPAFEDSKPQAVVTLAPGESGYASVLLAAADGSGSNGYTAKSLEVYFDTGASTAAHPSLPAKGVYVDDSIGVSYWQSTMADALTW
ncbi:DUF4232 domain-containing protein [Streptomyces fulvoviolaceus]|uniref:DUF4232 domain-containing protein n=1 Tax=Streptomyces fulvoviolaceus TaxID=285535 RepID=UPI0021C0FDBD|nr:DUF4232 domain-containing protein [Streptomyces fulvoviolaceus]MCT9075165.1 DUF4232 domain-containing protein [Streptomyces fulvoviolaceus]